MRDRVAIILALVLMVLYVDMGRAQDEWDLPFDQVFESTVIHPHIALEVRIVDNADAVCRQYAKDVNYEMEHCALQWEPKNGIRKCVLIMDKDRLTLGDLGHELRHCYEDDWHVYRPTRGVKRR